MGFFSWETSDTNRSISNLYSGKGTFPVTLLEPNGSKIREEYYEGYGDFDGHDVYILLALWNHEMHDIPEEELARTANEDLRELGIEIAFGDKEIKYPIKIVEDDNLEYNDVPASKMCPYQGFFYN